MKNFLLIAISFLLSLLANAQNVGIGETNPVESKLQIKTNDSAALLIQNTATPLQTKTALFLKSDNNYSGSIATVKTATQTYRMGLFTFGGTQASVLRERLSILDDGKVGIGTITPTAKLEVAGTFKLADGTQGVNKVLTSDAAGNASWEIQAPAAFDNVERFQYEIRASSSNPTALSTGYNYGTATTTYTAGASNFRINITKAGLYHFDVHFNHSIIGNFSLTSPSPLTNEIAIQVGSKSLFGFAPFYNNLNGSLSSSSYDKSFDVYVAAPGSIYVGSEKKSGNFSYSIIVTGNLIAE